MISGIVTDEMDLPLPGVNVYIKGIKESQLTLMENLASKLKRR
jgi:hypothetical protein